MPELKEDEASKLVLLALDQAFRNHGFSGSPSKTHLTKVVFNIADRLELPITRCWFKFGQYTASPLVTPEHLATIRSQGVGSLSSRVNRDLADVFARIKEEAEKWVSFFYEPLDQYLPEYYETEAPEAYRGLYVSNFRMMSTMQSLSKEEDYSAVQTRFSDSLAPAITDYHKAAAPFVKDEEARNLVIDYSSFVEELVIRFDRADSQFDLAAWRSFFERVTEIYVTFIWNLPAAQIGYETVVGPSSEGVGFQMLQTSLRGPEYRAQLFQSLVAEAEERGYLPTEEDMSRLVSEARQRSATRAGAVEKISHIARKSDWGEDGRGLS